MEENKENNKITKFDSSVYYKVGADSFLDNLQKGVRLFKRAVLHAFDNSTPDQYPNLREKNPQFKYYLSSLATSYGALKMYEYVHFCLLKLMGANRIEDFSILKSLSSLGEQEPYIVDFANVLSSVNDLVSDSLSRMVDFDSLSESNVKNCKLKVVSYDGSLISLNDYFTRGDVNNEIIEAERLIAANQFGKAINLLKKQDLSRFHKAKTELAICYFLIGDTQKAIDTTMDNGELDFNDYNNLLLFYYEMKDKENFDKVKNKLLKQKKHSDDENFKLGISFSQVGEHSLCKTYLEKYIYSDPSDLKTNLLYAIACINSEQYGIAKQKLKYLQDIDIFDQLVYKDYLKFCQLKPKYKLEYSFDLQQKSSYRYNKIIEKLIDLDQDDFEIELLKNIDLIGWAARSTYCVSKKLFLVKVSHINNALILNYLENVLLDKFVDDDIKYMIVLNKLENTILFNNRIIYVSNNLCYRIYTPFKEDSVIDEKVNYGNIKSYKRVNAKLYEAYCMAIMYIMSSQPKYSNINLFYVVDFNLLINQLDNVDDLEFYKAVSVSLVTIYYEYLEKMINSSTITIKLKSMPEFSKKKTSIKSPSFKGVCRFFEVDEEYANSINNKIKDIMEAK